MTIEELLQILNQSGGSGPPSGSAAPTASVTPSSLASAGGTGTQIGNLVDPAIGVNPGAASAEGGAIGGGIGGLLGLIFGPAGSALGSLGGGFLGDVIGGAVGGGVPRAQKSQGIEAALGQSGNPLDALIAKYIGAGINKGGVLSESGGSTLEGGSRRFAAMLEAITGQSAPGVTPAGANATNFGNPSLGGAAGLYRLPAGYEFASDPSKLPQIFQDIMGAIGNNAPGEGFKGGAGPQEEWQRVLRELIQQGALQKYQGPLGAAGGGGTSAGAIPNVSLPHPLASTGNPATAPAPYPV